MESKPVCRHCRKTIRDPNSRIKTSPIGMRWHASAPRRHDGKGKKMKTDFDYRKNQMDAKDRGERRMLLKSRNTCTVGGKNSRLT